MFFLRCGGGRTPLLFLLPVALFLVAPLVQAQDDSGLISGFRTNPTAARRASVERFATLHRKDQSGAMASLALGVVAYEQRDAPGAIRHLVAAQSRLPKLSDYTSYYLAAAHVLAKEYPQAIQSLQAAKASTMPSALSARAVLMEARAMVEINAPAGAVQLLRSRYTELPQPDGDLQLAVSYQAAQDLANAAAYYQRVYYSYPVSEAAGTAAGALTGLRDSMGPAYTPPTPAQMLERADRWLAAKEYAKARLEFEAILGQTGGVERDQASVRMGAADYLHGDTSPAFRYLKSLGLIHSEAEAERLYYLAECQRRLNDEEGMLETVAVLGKQYPASRWRLKALLAIGNRFIVQNRPDAFVPLFRAAYQSFPDDPQGAYCHWKVAWSAYLGRQKEARELLREHLARYPDDAKTSSAIYFLGRLSEGDKDLSAARTYYSRIQESFPNYYYASLARTRMADPRIVAAPNSPKTAEWLSGLPFAPARANSSPDPSPITRQRLERARLLDAGGFSDWAETELRYGARHDGQPQVMAMELAKNSKVAYVGMRWMKSLVPDYLATPFDQQPPIFWRYLFPLPYQKDLVRYAKLHNLDPYILAGLIRQESEFNPAAISRASAYGLTQILPRTGRELAKRDGVRRFRSSMLLQPTINLQLGSRYLRTILDQWGGKWEETLASYNAGKARVNDWITWNNFQEPAEFVETIPFSETRDYVQAVLRNAALYKRLYGDSISEVRSTNAPPSPKRTARAKPTHPVS